MVDILIQRCGFLFWPQMLLSIAVITMVVSYLVALKRGEVCTGQRPWVDSLEPLAGMAVSLGLFGSVVGFIAAFSGFQQGVNVSTFASGLSVAYWTTGVGIATSLIATLGSYLLNILNR